MKLATLFGLGLVFAASAAQAATIDFHIAAGTGSSPWNTQATLVSAHVGDTVKIFNDDTVNHRLHTEGAPCDHGPEMAPGDTYACEITSAYDSVGDGPLYDHDFGPDASFWIVTQ